MRKTTFRKIAKGKAPKVSSLNEVRELIKNMVNRSMQIAEIKNYHKKNQNIFESRLIKKEENYVIKDSNFSGRIYPQNNESLKWAFISRS